MHAEVNGYRSSARSDRIHNGRDAAWYCGIRRCDMASLYLSLRKEYSIHSRHLGRLWVVMNFASGDLARWIVVTLIFKVTLDDLQRSAAAGQNTVRAMPETRLPICLPNFHLPSVSSTISRNRFIIAGLITLRRYLVTRTK